MARNLTQPALCEEAGGGLSVNAYKKYEWRNGNALPDEERLNQIIAVLGEEATDLTVLHSEALTAKTAWQLAQRYPNQLPEPPPPSRRKEPWRGYTYNNLLRRSVDSIASNCLHTETELGSIVGWRHFLENDDLPVTAMASSYGVRILLLANHAGSVPSIGQIRESILKLELEGGGWNARTQNRLARVEAYGPILHALRLSGLSDSELSKRVDHYEEILDPAFDPATWTYTSILTTACNTLSAVHPESTQIPVLLEALFDGARESGDEAWWTPSISTKRAEKLSASAVHTSRAIVAFSQAPPEAADQYRPIATKAVRWLDRQRKYGNVYDMIERNKPDDQDVLNMRHFAAAWVGRALTHGSRWTDEVRVESLRFAEDHILDSVGLDGLWRWESGEAPIWMTFQGLRSLGEIALAIHDQTRQEF